MRKKYLFVLLSLWLIGCGDVVKEKKDDTKSLMPGLWDLVSNTPTNCYERLKINADSTFWWYNGTTKKTSVGSWDRESENTLSFKHTGRPWEIVKFSVDERELALVQVGVFKTYIHVPETGYTTACPQSAQ